VDVITENNFHDLVKDAIPPQLVVPNETHYSPFIAFDFGICENEHGELEPQLIEMQGFPTLFGYQVWQEEATRKVFNIPDHF
ncbi:hypothetical protein ABTL91_20145, partial [Acinetobacter baumannii]